ncbi:MAG: archaeosortase/exosortase family protein [Gammaproteobacteria bacterium]|nr:archaeosortase/exosortase family protein [Gammaproteobacteria bacterium]
MSNSRLLIFVALFIAVFFGCEALYMQSRGTGFERVFIDILTVKPSAALINWFSPNEGVSAQGPRLMSPFARLSVLNGCEGTEAMFLLIAAITAFAAPWRHKLIGALLGIGLVYAFNQIRIVVLYYSFRTDKAVFELIHGTVGPTVIVLVACAFFFWWLKQIPAPTLASAPHA